MTHFKKDILNENADKEDIRLNKLMSDAGFCSRREADRLIAAGKVFVDGKPAVVGTRVTAHQCVEVDGRRIRQNNHLILIALNKPRGIVCTTDRIREKDNIIDFIKYPERIYPIGRLDKDSEGLILLTNDGSLVNHILKASQYHEKEYIVRVNKKITDAFIKGMSEGVPILDTVTRPCIIHKKDDYTFSIILTQGLNRQIRNMCAYFDYRVVRLKRIRVMNIRLGNLKSGQWRNVTAEELNELKHQFMKGTRPGQVK
jgi:23S rRNA pseudouridine2604 synthase